MPANHPPSDTVGGEARVRGTVPRLYQQAFDELARQIRDGISVQGTRLTEAGVASQFGISRAPARRALAELARCGFVAKADGRGYVVLSIEDAGRAPADPGVVQTARTPSDAAATADGTTRLAPPSSWARIYDDVEREIVARIAFASWRVNEAAMARHYRVSRTVTREVLGRLQQQGLIRKDGRSRWYAPALTPKHVGELYEVRGLLEPVALVKAAPFVPADFLASMRAHLEHAQTHANAVTGATLDALETEMHVQLLGYCDNPTLMQAIDLQQSLLIAHRFLYRQTSRLFEGEPFLPEHLEIVDRLERGRPDAAAEQLEHHLRVSRDRALHRIDAINQQYEPDGLSYLDRL
ncbi:GntR family transcriptional regulator [Rhodovibrio salinarum]|uniref:HTH gntR-type domain-containing protein n=1 Tax=Rhodovibrio salinarum TaxID=1087 RepID=A0A934QL20_9PROT|nr:GntR family transcriptional regulator [Rhodovibrio salinarum]MBK1698883.1 hypothetical protein [Rhodovibrio salinarum]